MKKSYFFFFLIIASGIIILGVLFFILPPEKGRHPSKMKGWEGLEKKSLEKEKEEKEKKKAILHGRLYFPDGTPARLAPFFCRLEDEKAPSVAERQWLQGPYTSDTEGGFTVDLEPCLDCTLEILVRGFGPAEQRLGPTPPGRSISGKKFVLIPGIVVLRGRVVDGEGKPLSGAVLELSNPELMFYRERFITDDSGFFEIKADRIAGTFTGKIRMDRTGEEVLLEEAAAGSVDLVVVLKKPAAQK